MPVTKKIIIVATKFDRTQEAWEILNQRGWRPVKDESTVPSEKKLVSRDKRNTPVLDVEWEEWEYK